MSYITTARIAAAGAFPYFSRLESFPRSNEISETTFQGKVPPVCQGSDLLAFDFAI